MKVEFLLRYNNNINTNKKNISFKEKEKNEYPKITPPIIILSSLAAVSVISTTVLAIKNHKLKNKLKVRNDKSKNELMKQFGVVKKDNKVILKIKKDDLKFKKFEKLSDSEVNLLLQDITNIEGDLILNLRNNIKAPNLKKISNNFILTGGKNIELPNLKKIGNDFTISTAKDIKLDNLKEVGGDCGLCHIENIDLKSLKNIKKSLCINLVNKIKINLLEQVDTLLISISDSIEIKNLKTINNKIDSVLNMVKNSKFSKYFQDNLQIINCNNNYFLDSK